MSVFFPEISHTSDKMENVIRVMETMRSTRDPYLKLNIMFILSRDDEKFLFETIAYSLRLFSNCRVKNRIVFGILEACLEKKWTMYPDNIFYEKKVMQGLAEKYL